MKAAILIVVAFFAWKAILVIAVVWLLVAFVVGVLLGRYLGRRAIRPPSPHGGPKPYLYDQDAE